MGLIVPLLAMIAFLTASPACTARAAEAPQPAAAPATPAAAPSAAAKPVPPKPTGIHYLYLIRHGIYDRNDSLSDETGNGLNAQGHLQARLAGERLKGLHLKLGRIVSSNYTRARETAADIAALLGRPVTVDTLLHECTPFAARTDYMANAAPGEIDACEANLAAAWSKYMTASPDSNVVDLLVCHGNVIRWFAARAMGADTKRWSSLDVANGSITIISVGPDGASKLAVFSDVAHVPPDQQTWTGRGAGWKPSAH